jgi:phospholipid/cholesterol/gamma-HCH transport system ATP-binding protein
MSEPNIHEIARQSTVPGDEVIDPVTGQLAAIRYVNVWKTFGTQAVLRGLNLVVPRGRITIIIGRSGTGKSVTLKHVMGLMRADKGEVWVGEDNLSKLSDKALRAVRNRFGIVFQDAALFDSMSVYENIAFPLREHSRLREREIKAKVDDLLVLTGLVGAENKIPGQLSGGMRKRVGLARALVRDPEFILYDEPTTGLDPILAAAMDKLIVDTQKARPGLTSVVISHDMHAVLHIADKIAMFVDGVVAFEGPPDYFSQSDDPLVKQFLTGSLDGPMKV